MSVFCGFSSWQELLCLTCGAVLNIRFSPVLGESPARMLAYALGVVVN